jgi:polyhydroxyalkanoate synthesis repressor PhaR
MNDKTEHPSDEPRIIKKYPNRRVYDTKESKYIKVDDIRTMVLEGVDFQVVDSQSGEDITRSVLLQIIFEAESEVNPLFSNDNLRNFIRYSGMNNNMFSSYLNQSLEFFNQQQKEMTRYFQDSMQSNPFDAMNPFSEKNMAMWQNMQEQFFNPLAANKKQDSNKD